MKILEKQIQKKIIEWLNWQKDIYFLRNNSVCGAFKRKNGSMGWIKNNKPGSPDILICRRGIFIGCEVKTEKGKQSEFQKQAQQDIIRAGGKYILVRSFEEFLEKIK